MLTYILGYMTDLDKEYVQDILIANMYYASEIRQQVASKRYCQGKDIRNRHKGALFENSIARIDAIICRNHQDTSQGRNKQLAINSIRKLDYQSHTSGLNQHTS